jgi:mxaK protein
VKRAHGHLVFTLVAAALSVLTAGEALRLQHAQRINMSVAGWAAAPISDPSAADHLPPEARLARAVALARLDYDGALAAYKSIIQSNREDLHRIALYDLGNLNLRQAVQYGLADEAQSLPLTELAKQSYRDLLRRDPTDWDARYNLERALRLAPEEDADDNEDTAPPDPRQHERSTIADPRMDLP